MTKSAERPDWIERARAGWQYRGAKRPPFAVAPKAGEESVWDYPRPPVVVRDTRHVVVQHNGIVVAETRAAWRLLETSHPPTWYLPRADVDATWVVDVGGGSFCEWKGQARYFDVLGTPRAGAGAHGDSERRLAHAAWSYPAVIDDAYREIAGALAFYATSLTCLVDGEQVRPQPGGFYGGWITREIVGPWKGEPGTSGW
jgi:uncharacterized protein (DUF427 family)